MYNVEDYIAECLDSVLDQSLSLSEYEIIIINDGSNDKSFDIASDYEKKFKNIILLTQKNAGIGAARNTGIENAKGKYIYFLDSDDYLASNVFENLLKVLEENNLEILGFQSTNTSSSELKTSKNVTSNSNVSDVIITDGITFLADYNYRAEVWWYIMGRDFFLNTGILFYDRKFVQDSYITPSIFIKAKKVCFIPWDIHRYRKNENSITNKKSTSHIERHMHDLVFSIEKLNSLIETVSDNLQCVKRLKNRQQGYVFFFLIRFAKSNMSFNELRSILNQFRQFKAYPITEFIGKDYNDFKYKVLVFIFNRPFLLFPFLYIFRAIYSMLR